MNIFCCGWIACQTWGTLFVEVNILFHSAQNMCNGIRLRTKESRYVHARRCTRKRKCSMSFAMKFLFYTRFSHRPNMSWCECRPRGYRETIEILWTSLESYLWCGRLSALFRNEKNWRRTQIGKVETCL